VSGLELVIVGIVAVATSALTAMAGAGGGLILLIVLLQFLAPEIAIPLHGVIQLVSNGSRAATLRAHVETRLLGWYVIPLVPFAIVGFLLVDAVPGDATRAAIGVFALMATWWPAATAWLAPRASGDVRRFMWVGAVAGVTNPTLGAPGPLLAPAFRAATRSHIAMVATFAVSQVLNHSVKVIVFAIAGLAWSEHYGVLVVAGAGVIVGTLMGARMLGRASPATLSWLFRVAVTAGAARLLLSSWWG
jgi:uncharacterized membrane protein YfcA